MVIDSGTSAILLGADDSAAIHNVRLTGRPALLPLTPLPDLVWKLLRLTASLKFTLRALHVGVASVAKHLCTAFPSIQCRLADDPFVSHRVSNMC